MLRLTTDWGKLHRMEKTAGSWVLQNAVTGTWVKDSANGLAQPSAGDYAYPILTESNRDGSVGFTGDVSVTGNVTVAYGKFAGITDQYEGTPAIGDTLWVTASGKLANKTTMAFAAGTDPSDASAAEVAASAMAVCTKAPYEMTYMGRTVNVIEFVTK